MRSRNIKPGFFKNDTLSEIEPLGRILFEGLWCLADRKGRLKDRPKRIKAEILPYNDCDVDSFLNDLQKKGFILRYIIEDNRYIQIINFLKHQRPHPNEKASEIPAPIKEQTTYDQGLTNDAPKSEQGITKECSNPSDIMIPDIMIPDSLNSLSALADKQPSPAALSKSKHFSEKLEDSQLEPILTLCDAITKRVRKESNGKKRFEPYKFIQRQVNNKGHPQAILKALESMLDWHKIKNTWAYAQKVMEQESAKAYARDNEEAHEKLKAEWVSWEKTEQFKKLSELTENIGNFNAI